ncbi:MAG: HD domain-containing protein [Planctomycetes bacterium]|nr:HD domain-containing protein [Planctomycetota bacterium]MCB9917655.1 HD domain-containing protein [Planctomycetota bacterium]
MNEHSDHETRRRRSFFGERLWVVLLPLLVMTSLTLSTWVALLVRDERDAMRRRELEAGIERILAGSSSELGQAIESTNRTQTRFLVESVAKMVQGRAALYHGKGGLLAQADHAPRASETFEMMSEALEEILVWGPAKGIGGSKVGEIRVHVPVPAQAGFPWSLFVGILATCSIISGIVLYALARCLAPMQRLRHVFTRLGEAGPDAVVVPGERFAEFGQVREEMLDCLDKLKERQLRAEESFVEVALSLAREYEYHREGAIGHAQRVRRYASWIGERLRLPPGERDALEVAALCHDLGKLPAMQIESTLDIEGIDAETLAETADVLGKQTFEQIDTMHPVLGAAFFEAMPGLEDVAQIVVAHHENWDGSGYPGNLAGDEIPLGSRLIRIADAFDRAYSNVAEDQSAQDVLDTLAEEKGTSFDPFLFEVFREEVAVHLLERRRLQVTLKARKAEREAAATSAS